jgi:hypothetical protein
VTAPYKIRKLTNQRLGCMRVCMRKNYMIVIHARDTAWKTVTEVAVQDCCKLLPIVVNEFHYR